MNSTEILSQKLGKVGIQFCKYNPDFTLLQTWYPLHWALGVAASLTGDFSFKRNSHNVMNMVLMTTLMVAMIFLKMMVMMN